MADAGVAVIFSAPHESQQRRQALASTIGLLLSLQRSANFRANNPGLISHVDILVNDLIDIALLFTCIRSSEPDSGLEEDASDTRSTIGAEDPPNAADS